MYWRKYYEIARMGFMEASAYRFNALMGLVTSVLYLIMVYAIWTSIARSGQLAGGLSTVLTYILIGQVVSNSVFVSVEDFLSEKVREGTIVNELKRPVSFRRQAYFYMMGRMLFNTVFRGAPLFLLGVVFLDLGFPGVLQSLAFIASLFLGFNLVFSFSYITSMLIFWTKIGWGIRAMRGNIQSVFSGVMFPLYLLPDSLKTVFDLLPFQAMADGPITIFTRGTGITSTLGTQFVWIVVMLVFGEFAWRKAKTKLTVQGG